VKRNITCFCGRVFSVDAAEEIDLDKSPECIGQITGGSFMSFTCPGCGKIHKPEFPVTLRWPSKKLRLEVLPELDRGAFYRRKKDSPHTETVIGYPELIDRIAVIRDGLEPAVIEALKCFLLLKAGEQYPERKPDIWYQGKGPDGVEFHVYGLRTGEMGVTKIPRELYEKTLGDFKKSPRSELFSSLRTRSYLSVQNTFRAE
jgi:hypothetical protein